MSISLGSTEKIALTSTGYFPIVYKYGNSKVYQPGTRGTIYTDATRDIRPTVTSGYVPRFQIREMSSGSLDYKTVTTLAGYSMVEFGSSGNPVTQVSGITTWGLTASTAGTYSYWVFPNLCNFGTAYSAGWKMYSPVCGDKPYTGSVVSYNQTGLRLITNSAVAAKQEFHVIVTTWTIDRPVSTTASDPIYYIDEIWIPRQHTTSLGDVNTFVHLDLSKHAGYQNANLCGYAYYEKEETTDWPASSAIGAPLIKLNENSISLASTSQYGITFSVQFILVFKAD